jgi:hypothetical protein
MTCGGDGALNDPADVNGAGATQFPDRHVSPAVHGWPSLQAVLSATVGQRPVATMQAPATWH